MALALGTLTGFLELDASAFDSALGGAADKLRDFGGKGAALAAGAGVAIGGAIAAGVLGAMNVEAANDKLTAQLGLTATESERIGGVAGSLYANAYGGSLEEVNTAVGAVMSSIGGMRDASSADIEAMSAKVLDLAAGFDVDVTRAAQVAGQMITSGLAGDGAEAMDLLTASMQRVPAAVREDILDAVDEYGPFMSTLGLQGEQAFGLLVTAAEKGAFGIDKTGDALKEFTIRATDMSAASKVGFDALGLSQEEMSAKLLAGGETAAGAFDQIVTGLLGIKDPTEQSAAALALFGTPLEDLNTSEIPAFLTSLAGASEAMDGSAGASERFGTALNSNATASLESAKRQAEQFVVGLANGLLPAVDMVAAALAGGFAPAVDVGAAALSALGSAVPTPILQGAAVVVGALVGVLITQAAVTTAASVATGAYAAVKGIFITTTSAETGVTTLSTVARVAHTASTVAGTIATGAATVAHGIATAAVGAWTAAQWLLNAALAANPIGAVIAIVALLVAGLVIAYRESETFRDIVDGAFTTVKQGAGDAVGAMIDGFKLLVTVWLTAADAIVSGAATALGWIPGLGDKLQAANTAFDNMKDGILDTLDDAAQKAYGFGEKAGGNVASGASSAAPKAYAAGGGLVNDLGRGIGAGDGVASAAGYAVGAAAGQGLVNGIASKRLAVAREAQMLAIAAGEAMRGGLQVRSPSRLTTYYGQMLGEGLALGMLSSTALVSDASDSLTRAAFPRLDVPTAPRGVRARGGDGGSAAGGSGSRALVHIEHMHVRNEEEVARRIRMAQEDAETLGNFRAIAAGV